jgi:gluconate 2-dehydrogenase gamma chain
MSLRMKRRDLLKLGASAAAAPAAGFAQQHDHPPAHAAAGPSSVPWKPELFDDHQNQTVVALVDLIIPATDTPGAREALVNRHLDHILAASPEEEKTRFREGLWWVDGYAIRRHGKPYAGCTPVEQTAILQAMEAGADPEIAPGHRFFGLLKGMIAEIYYATQIGFNELNKGGRVPATFACRHPEHA